MQALERIRGRAKKETDVVAATGRLKNHEGYARAVGQFDELSAELKSHIDKFEQIKATSVREVSQARAYIRNESRMWDLRPEEIAVVARMRIRTGQLPEDLHDPCDLVDSITDPDARPLILKFDFFRRAVEVLKIAVEIQRKEVAKQKRRAIADICSSLEPNYAPIARKIAESLLELGAALQEERAFCHQLIAEDAELAQGLKPRPFFPIGILASADLHVWIAEAMETGLVDPTDPRASALGAASKATA